MYKKILVPLDSSELAEKILPQVEELAACMKSEILLLTVGNPGSAAIMSEVGGQIMNQIRDISRKTSENKLNMVAEKLAVKGLKVSVKYREGNPAEKIIQTANETGCDLIAMATHGCGEIAWVLGSVAEKVASHATVPVLLLRVLETPMPIAKSQPAATSTESKSWGNE